MAETTKFTYVSLNNLNQYTTLSKKYFEGKISEADARSLKTVAIEGHTLKFYKVAEPVGDTAPAYTIELPETDLSDFMHLIKNATAGDVVITNANGSVADGGVKLADLAKSADVTKEIGDAKTELNKKVEANTTAIAKLNGAEDAEGSVAKAVKDAKTAVEAKIGNLENLTTTEKDDLVSAVNENKAAIDSVKTAGEITVDTTTTTEGMAKSYTIKQGDKAVTTIDIPKDMVVKSGVVQENPKGLEAGTYLVLTLANATEDTIYINVGKLVDIYTVKAKATQIQLAIDSSTREISATIVAGSVDTAELADGAVVTAKIADGNVTKAKLAKAVQDSLDKADNALQEADVATLRADVAANKASLAEGGATANAIKANKEAAAKAQGDVNALATRVETLESVEYVEATEAEIKAMFPTA